MAKKRPPDTAEQVRALYDRPATDPLTRKDGLCYVCKGERRPIAVEYDDPFCSVECCRGHYRLPAVASYDGQRSAAQKRASAKRKAVFA